MGGQTSEVKIGSMNPQDNPADTPGRDINSGVLRQDSRNLSQVQININAINLSDGEENVPSERGEFQEQASYAVYVEAEREAA